MLKGKRRRQKAVGRAIVIRPTRYFAAATERKPKNAQAAAERPQTHKDKPPELLKAYAVAEKALEAYENAVENMIRLEFKHGIVK
jgi:hypothetical protein